MGSISSYVEYFRKIAEEHPEIDGFYMMDVNEIIGGLRSTIKYPALILEPISGRYSVSNPDNVLEVIDGGFLIIDHLDNPDDFQGEIILIDRMKEIGQHVISSMLKDKMECDSLTENAISCLKIDSLRFEIFGPIMGNDYGLIYNFTLRCNF